MSRCLPVRSNLEYLKKYAKEVLRKQRQQDPTAKLADALHAVAVEYGFSNWAALKADVGSLAGRNPFVGVWQMDPRLRSSDTPFHRATLEFAVAGDVVTITDTAIDTSGHEERGTSIIRADGREHAFEYGYVLRGSWRGPYALEAVVAKDDREVSRVAYDVSRDGRTRRVGGPLLEHEESTVWRDVIGAARPAGRAPAGRVVRSHGCRTV